jgi:putative transposase
LLDEGATLFGTSAGQQLRQQEAVQVELYEQIGRLKMELEWLKKKAARFGRGETRHD